MYRWAQIVTLISGPNTRTDQHKLTRELNEADIWGNGNSPHGYTCHTSSQDNLANVEIRR